MCLQIVVKVGKACPMFICDWCQKPIKNVASANVVWEEPDDFRNGLYNPLFAHAECDGALGPSFNCWLSLDRFLIHLENNLKFTPQKRKIAENLARAFTPLP